MMRNSRAAPETRRKKSSRNLGQNSPKRKSRNMSRRPRTTRRDMKRNVEPRKRGEFRSLARTKVNLNRSQMRNHPRRLPKSHPNRTTQLSTPVKRSRRSSQATMPSPDWFPQDSRNKTQTALSVIFNPKLPRNTETSLKSNRLRSTSSSKKIKRDTRET